MLKNPLYPLYPSINYFQSVRACACAHTCNELKNTVDTVDMYKGV